MNISPDIKATYEKLDVAYETLTENYLTINEDNISEALVKHSPNYAFMGAVTAYAKHMMDSKEIELEKLEFDLRKEAAEILKARGVRATKDAVDSETMSNPSLIASKEAVSESQFTYNLAKNILSSMEHQKDMLVQISSNRRSELKLHT